MRALWIEIQRTRRPWESMKSRPVRALWIEIWFTSSNLYSSPRSRPVRALWIEMSVDSFICPHLLSRPVRALWIEMLQVGFRQSEYFWEKSLMI